MSGKNPIQQGYQQSAASAKSQDDHMEKISNKNAVQFKSASGQTHSHQFPGYYQSEADDTTMGYRAIAGGAAPEDVGGITDSMRAADVAALQNRKVDLTSADIQWFEQRRMEREKLEFDNWARVNLDLSNPNTARWFQSIYPEYMQRRERWIDDQHNVSARAAKIRLRGIKDKEDLYFLWAVQTGRITLPSRAIWNPRSSVSTEQQFARGIFNPRRYTTGEPVLAQAGGMGNDWFNLGGAARERTAGYPSSGTRRPTTFGGRLTNDPQPDAT